MTPGSRVALALLVLLASAAGCGGSDSRAEEAATGTTRGMDSLAGHVSPHGDSVAAHGGGPEQVHSGAYNLVQQAETAVEDVNRRTRDLESALGDL